VNGKIETKSGFKLKENDTVEISETDESKYVARSAIKLKKYLEEFPHDIESKVALDI
jgi:predicted rRNA methylase YqxC with S4 and FtsJ domains